MREKWSSSIGFILASIGSAVGIGNIWRFPYMVGENGGGAFLIPYLIAVFLFGLPLMILEFALGRHFKTSVVPAFSTMGKKFRIAGFFLVFVMGMILSYYLVITGWVLAYSLFFITGNPIPFSQFTGSYYPLLFFLISGGISLLVVRAGVRQGIEKLSKILIPLLFAMLLLLVIFALSLPGAAQGIEFYLTPDFGKLTDPFVWTAAFGQAFFSLGVGTGIMLTYGSYMRDENIAKSAGIITVSDLLVAILGGFVVFQQAFGKLPVHNAFTSVHMDKNNRINKIDVCYHPELFVEMPVEGVSQEDAIRIAVDTLKGEKRLAKEVFAEQVIYPKENRYHVSWKVRVPLINPIEDWHVFIDFKTGNVLDIVEALLKASGRGRVFIPNPVIALGDRTLTADSEIPDRAYSTVVLKELDGSGYLRGPYVDTCNTPNRAKEPDLIYYYKRHDHRFKEVMAYYHIDEAARYIHGLGFNNVCNRTVKVNVHGDFVDNSYYNHDTRELTFGTWFIDDAEDGDVILHEYAHAIMDDQVPSFGLTRNTCPIAEGFGDFFAACFFAEINDGFNRECVGDWNGKGKIGDCVSRVDSKKHYLEDFLGLDSCDRDGEIWSASLWDIYLHMGGASKIKVRRLAARDNAIRLVIESNFNLNLNSRFEDAADAVIIADKNIYNGAYEHLIREVLVKRGILFPLVKVEMQAEAEPYVVRVGNFLTFSINLTNAGEVIWKKAKIVISIHNKTGLFIKKLVKRINNVKAGAQKSTEKSWRIPKRLKKGEYSYTVSAYYSRKKIGLAEGEFKMIV